MDELTLSLFSLHEIWLWKYGFLWKTVSWSILLCRSGVYEMSEAEGVQRGTKIVIHLKGECYDYCKEDIISGNAEFFRQLFPYMAFVYAWIVPLLVNQLLLQLLMEQFDTLPIQYRHIEHMHEGVYNFCLHRFYWNLFKTKVFLFEL